MLKFCLLYFFTILFLIFKSSLQLKARCFMIPDKEAKISGEVVFEQDEENSPVKMTLKVYGASKIHGFHIHERGSIEEGCVSAGAHYNPLNKFHGGPEGEERHMGDLGNIRTEDNNSILYTFTNDKISLYGDYSIMGRTCVVHANEDDLGAKIDDEESKKTGNSGPRLACGIVQNYNPFYSILLGMFVLIVGTGLSLYYFFCYRKNSEESSNLVENEVRNN